MYNFQFIDKDKVLFGGVEYRKEDFIKLIESDMFYTCFENNEILLESVSDEYDKNAHSLKTRKLNGTTLQKIIYGVPGTGKSYRVNEIIKEVYPTYNPGKSENKNIFRIAIHPGYDNSDFIGSIMPRYKLDSTSSDDSLYYFNPGVFTLALERALLVDGKEDIFLVIEDMTRGNISEIFGDIFQLLDRENGESDYSIRNDDIADYLLKNSELKNNKVLNNKNIYLPENFHILGTLNTSDQNIYPIDTAFTRRFGREYMSLKPKLDSTGKYINNCKFKIGKLETNWIKLYQVINKYIIEKMELSSDKQLGQFFIKFKDDILRSQNENDEFKSKLLSYLWEDVDQVNYNNNYRIFNNNIKSFESLIIKESESREIFSEEFINAYNE